MEGFCDLDPTNTHQELHVPKEELLQPTGPVTSPNPPIRSQDGTLTQNRPLDGRKVKATQSTAEYVADVASDCITPQVLPSPQISASSNTPPPSSSEETTPSSSSSSTMGEPWSADSYRRSQSAPDIQYMGRRNSPVAQSSPNRTQFPQAVAEEHELATERPINYHPTTGYHPLFPAYHQDLLTRHGNGQAILTRPLAQAGLPFVVNQEMANFNQVPLVYNGLQPVDFPPVTAYMGSARVDVIRNQPAWRTGIPIPAAYPAYGAFGTPNFPVEARPPQQYSTHLAPIRVEGGVNYNGFLPSSYQWNGRVVARHARAGVAGDRLNSEIRRVRRNLPVVLREEELDDSLDKYYAKWNGGYVEVTDDLIARCVCPADLLSFPCRWDELPGGCKMLRLCSQLEKYSNHVCPDAGFRSPDYEGFEESECPHIHWEVEISCRFVVKEGKARVQPDENDPRTCYMTNFKYYNCVAGHDLEWGRRVARDRFEYHVRDALMAGAVARVEPHTIILPRNYHRRMPNGPGRLPRLPY